VIVFSLVIARTRARDQARALGVPAARRAPAELAVRRPDPRPPRGPPLRPHRLAPPAMRCAARGEGPPQGNDGASAPLNQDDPLIRGIHFCCLQNGGRNCAPQPRRGGHSRHLSRGERSRWPRGPRDTPPARLQWCTETAHHTCSLGAPLQSRGLCGGDAAPRVTPQTKREPPHTVGRLSKNVLRD